MGTYAAGIALTNHAKDRISGRGIREWQVEQVMLYGRVSHVRSSTVYAVGSKEIQEYGKFLLPCLGVHVICASDSNVVITTYRNRDLRGLRP